MFEFGSFFYVWLLCVCMCSKAQRLAHTNFARWNNWNTKHGESTSGFWHNSHLALYCIQLEKMKKKDKHFSNQKTFLCFERRYSFVHPCILCSSRPRINVQIGGIHMYHTKKERQKKSLSQGFLHTFFFRSLSLLGQRQQARKKIWKNKTVAISLISPNLKWIRMVKSYCGSIKNIWLECLW